MSTFTFIVIAVMVLAWVTKNHDSVIAPVASSGALSEEEKQQKEQEAIARATGAEPPAKPEEPETIDWEARYKELQAKTDREREALKTTLPEKETAEESPQQDTPTVENVIQDLTSKYQENEGKLTDEDYKKAQELGISKDMIENYIYGVTKRQEEQTNEVLGVLGLPDQESGLKAYNMLMKFAADNFSPSEIAALNDNINSGVTAKMKMAVSQIKQKFEATRGSVRETTVTPSGSFKNEGTQGFRSMDEMRQAQRDPRYKTDSAYRADVERRTAIYLSRK